MAHRLCVAVLAFCLAVCAQVQTDSGDVRGVIRSGPDTYLAGVTVTLLNPSRGLERTATTDIRGEYRFSNVPSGNYEIHFDSPAIQSAGALTVTVSVGETVALHTVAEAIAATETPVFRVEASAERPTIETEQFQQAQTLELKQLQHLPINERNYLSLAMLTPGTTSADGLPGDRDSRPASSPHSALSFNGNNGRGNTFQIDGVENNYYSGDVRPSISQEAVQEFQVNRLNYSAETGWATGGAINVVSKSGTNNWHGNMFGFLRHRAVQARNYFDPDKSAFTRVQAGITAGGPVRMDKTFIFGAFERLQRRETAFVPIIRDRSAFSELTPSQEDLSNFLFSTGIPELQALSIGMQQALITDNYPATLALFENNSGEFPFAEDSNQFSMRLDHRFSDRHSFFVRGNLTDGFRDNSNFGSLIGFTRGRSVDRSDRTVVFSDSFVASPKFLSQTRFSIGQYDLDLLPLEPFGPELTINGYGLFWRDVFLPSNTKENHILAQQIFTKFSGNHVLKFGGEYNPVRNESGSDVPFSGRMFFGEAIPLGVVMNAVTGDPGFAEQLVQTLVALGQPQLVPNVADSISSLQSFNLGLPIFYSQTFGDPNWTGWFQRFGGFVQDTWRARSDLTLNFGVRYEYEGKDQPFPSDPNNIAPRFGFAWTPGGGGRTVLRGGYGMYYGAINSALAYLAIKFPTFPTVFAPVTGLPGSTNPATGQPVTSIDIYQGLAGAGVLGTRPITAADLALFGIDVSPDLPFGVRFGVDKDFVNPLTHQASLELEQAVGSWAFSAGGSFVRGLRGTTSLDRNIVRLGERPDDRPIFGVKDPTVLQRNIFESSANSTYLGLTLQAKKRLGGNVNLDAHYTWSKALDAVTDFNTDFQPMDQTNARAEWALSSFHLAHRFVLSAVLQSPWGRAGDQSFGKNVLADWVVAPIVIARSQRPFNVLTGFDNLGDGHATNKRPWPAGRNIGTGPGFATLDLRLSRAFAFSEGEWRLEFIAEAFNLLNRTNFRTLNNIVGDTGLDELPSPLTGHRGSTITPLAYTSALAPRQFQFGLKLYY